MGKGFCAPHCSIFGRVASTGSKVYLSKEIAFSSLMIALINGELHQ